MRKVGKGNADELGTIPIEYTRGKSRSGKSGKRRIVERSFVAWDGKCVSLEDGNPPVYTLLGNSMGDTLLRPDIGTKDALEFLLEHTRKGTYNVAYYFDHDVNYILKDLPAHHLKVLTELKHVTWNGYRIEHIPRKKFEVRHQETERSIRIDDVFDFFLCELPDALARWGVGDESAWIRIDTERKEANGRGFLEIDHVVDCWELSTGLTAMLMEDVKEAVHGCGFSIHRWYGPSAISSWLLSKHKVSNARAATPPDILRPCLVAYSGGWFDRFKIGYHDGPVYKADINSAFAAAMARVPNLSSGQWYHVDNPNMDEIRSVRFGLYHIRLGFGNKREAFNSLVNRAGTPQPLFLRDKSGATVHPTIVDGWYWNPEAALVVGHPDVEFVEAWIFDDDGTSPLSFIRDVYQERVNVKGHPVEKLIKWALAAIWGRAAQHAGWNRRTGQPPAGFQIEWAGWATSYIRAQVYRVAAPIGRAGGLISVDADGVLSTVPFSRRIASGTGLGEWKLSAYSGILYVGNGIYWARDDSGNWLEPKFRGTPKEMRRDIQAVWDMLDRGETVLHLVRNSFVGYGQIRQRGNSEWRKWVSIPYDVVLDASKYRQHVPRLCTVCRGKETPPSMTEALHDMAMIPCREVNSHAAPVPWAKSENSPNTAALHEIATEYM